MALDDPGNVTDTSRRFEIFVPSPKARINLGAPNKDTTGPFGYTGVSIQSDVHLFIDANKHTLFQTGQNYCGQVGGKWLQYSNADMIMSSTANVNVSADKKIVIASGAGQGQVTALDHGGSVRVVPYNALQLHYQVDRIQASLFEFFHGRRKRDEYTGKLKAVLAFGGASTEYFDGASDAGTEVQTEAELKGGFLTVSAGSLRELYPVANKRAVGKHDDDLGEDGDPVALLDPLVHKKVFGGSSKADALEFGFSGYLNRFDPYSKIDTSKLTGFLAKGLAGFRNLLAKMRRFADVCTKYAHLLTDNFLMKRAQAAMSAVDNLAKATWSAYNFVDLTFGSFIPGRDPNANLWARMQDERASGWDARRESATGLQEAGEDARKKVGDKKATLASGRGTFDLTDKTSLTIEWGGSPTSTVTIDLAQGRPPTPATLAFVIPANVLLGLPVDVRIDLAALNGSSQPLVPAWVPEADIVAWVAEELSLSASALEGATGNAGVETHPPRSTVSTLVSSLATVTGATRTFTEVVTPPATPSTVTLRLGDFVTLTVRRPTLSLRLIADGLLRAVTLDPAASGLDITDGAAVRAYVVNAIRTAVSNADVSATTDGVQIVSQNPGASSRIAVRDGTAQLLTDLGLEEHQEARGTARIPGLTADQLTKVSARQIADLIGSRSKLSVSVTGGVITLKSGHAPEDGKPSVVRVSGSMASAVFDSAQENEVKVEEVSESRKNLAEAEAEYRTLISWNHELQKLPEDTRNLTRPIREAVNEVVASMSALEKSVEDAVEFVGGPLKGLPSPPEAIGLIADNGITLGTRDRIVGVGGKGVVFITDGGSGEEDHAKFIPKVEQFVNLALSWDPIDKALSELIEDSASAKKEKKRPKSIGFRVLSDSAVDLMGSHAAQLSALGRGKLGAAGPDGKDIVGTGVARVTASYAAEVAAYRKVVISARNAGQDDKTGGRVEVAGQTIAIGGMNLAGDTKDFDSTQTPRFGVAPLDVDTFAGAEQLSDDELASLKKRMHDYAWPKTLLDGGNTGHPDTQRVFVHAAKETVIQVGTYLVHVDAQKGVTVGTRKPNADPTVNDVDEDKPRLELSDSIVSVYANKDTKTFWDDSGIGVFHKTGAQAANVFLEDAKVELKAGTQDSIVITSGETTLTSAKLNLLGKSVVAIDANGTIHLG